jgi:hypothetical protein
MRPIAVIAVSSITVITVWPVAVPVVAITRTDVAITRTDADADADPAAIPACFYLRR